MEFVRAQFVRQRDALQSIFWWYLLPFIPGLVLMVAGSMALQIDEGQAAIVRNLIGLAVMTAMFARTQWAYRPSRAYRVVLLDAGHLGQTFCLVATALGLAPFCSAALADSRIEQDLGLDGVGESVVYACGAGMRPSGVDWAPWPDSRRLPELAAPTSAKRLGRRSRRKPCSTTWSAMW